MINTKSLNLRSNKACSTYSQRFQYNYFQKPSLNLPIFKERKSSAIIKILKESKQNQDYIRFYSSHKNIKPISSIQQLQRKVEKKIQQIRLAQKYPYAAKINQFKKKQNILNLEQHRKTSKKDFINNRQNKFKIMRNENTFTRNQSELHKQIHRPVLQSLDHKIAISIQDFQIQKEAKQIKTQQSEILINFFKEQQLDNKQVNLLELKAGGNL